MERNPIVVNIRDSGQKVEDTRDRQTEGYGCGCGSGVSRS